jgi:hypothetical protein
MADSFFFMAECEWLIPDIDFPVERQRSVNARALFIQNNNLVEKFVRKIW